MVERGSNNRGIKKYIQRERERKKERREKEREKKVAEGGMERGDERSRWEVMTPIRGVEVSSLRGLGGISRGNQEERQTRPFNSGEIAMPDA